MKFKVLTSDGTTFYCESNSKESILDIPNIVFVDEVNEDNQIIDFIRPQLLNDIYGSIEEEEN